MPSTPPSLVKSAARAASVSTGWSSSRPTSDQVPEEMYAAGSSPSGAATTGRVVRPDRHDRHVGAQPELGGHVGQQRPDDVARGAQRRQDRGGHADQVGELGGPGPRADVVQPGRGGVGALGPHLAGEPVAQQVRQQQRRVAAFSSSGVPAAAELVDRVERQLLDAGAGVQLGRVDLLQHPRGDAVGARVTVGVRLAEQLLPRVEQPVVHGPGVDPDAVHRTTGRGRPQPRQHLAVQAGHVPVQRPVDADGRVGEPVHLGQRERLRADLGDHHPPEVAPRSTATTRLVAAVVAASGGVIGGTQPPRPRRPARAARSCASCRDRTARTRHWRCARAAPRA